MIACFEMTHEGSYGIQDVFGHSNFGNWSLFMRRLNCFIRVTRKDMVQRFYVGGYLGRVDLMLVHFMVF